MIWPVLERAGGAAGRGAGPGGEGGGGAAEGGELAEAAPEEMAVGVAAHTLRPRVCLGSIEASAERGSPRTWLADGKTRRRERARGAEEQAAPEASSVALAGASAAGAAAAGAAAAGASSATGHRSAAAAAAAAAAREVESSLNEFARELATEAAGVPPTDELSVELSS